MQTQILLVGLSHHVAPVELRERLTLAGPEASALARRLAGADAEVICLSTCNRTELYVAGEGAEAAAERAVEALVDLARVGAPELTAILDRRRGEDAALHLFRVAAGLDSLVPGEAQILGQVRAAYEQGVAGVLLDRLFREAIHTGRKVRAETAIGELPTSVAAAAAALAEQVFGDLTSCRVLLVGAGKTGELAAQSLIARGASIAYVANRSLDKARELATRFDAAALGLDGMRERLPAVDVVLSSTSAPTHVLRREDVEATLRLRRGRPLFLIDIAVPRDIDPAVHELNGCFVYDIDDLEAVVSETVPGRAQEVVRAEAIVQVEARRFHEWVAAREIAPAISSLRAKAEEIRAAELARVRSRLDRLSERERAAVEALTARIVDKLLHRPTVRMKEAAAGADGSVYADVLRDLFGLADDAAPARDPRE